ncbi:hypothetical protein [Sporosarcina sp. Te-1]|uniref:hypothetical protein n=1 Tax=Sporosarcina sp. Te-1 TaxID=2818390 RepID=UPI001A9EE566|nr:hypothetical protein [Sporosarcina sp. Te-1]QTD40881.1 hypothetical protein J3U78_19400 [Sporosarcina sp. Te-1]
MHDELYGKLGKGAREHFRFDDSAYFFVSHVTATPTCTMFSVCTSFEDHPNLHHLQDRYFLCFTCSEEEKERTIEKGLAIVKENYGGEPDYFLMKVLFTGMFQWRYEVQIPIP